MTPNFSINNTRTRFSDNLSVVLLMWNTKFKWGHSNGILTLNYTYLARDRNVRVSSKFINWHSLEKFCFTFPAPLFNRAITVVWMSFRAQRPDVSTHWIHSKSLHTHCPVSSCVFTALHSLDFWRKIQNKANRHLSSAPPQSQFSYFPVIYET